MSMGYRLAFGIGSYLLLTGLACSSGEQAASGSGVPEASKTIVAVANMSHPGFSSWGDDGRAVGMEVDLVEAAAANLGYKVEWVELSFGELLPAVQAGEADVAVTTIGITEDRKKIVDFSKPYFSTQIVALVKGIPGRLESLTDLAHGRVGVDEGTSSFPVARARWPEATLVGSVSDGMTWGQLVEAGVIDAHVVDGSDQERLESIDGIALYRIEESLAEEVFGIAVGKGSDELLVALNAAIDQLELGTNPPPNR